MYPSNPRHVAQVLRGIREAEDIYMTDPTGTAGMMVSHTDGKQEPFDPDKLLASIQKAGGDCLSDDVLSGIADEVTNVVKSKGGVDASALRGMVSERLTAASQKAGDAYNKGKAEPIKASEATEFSYRTARMLRGLDPFPVISAARQKSPRRAAPRQVATSTKRETVRLYECCSFCE